METMGTDPTYWSGSNRRSTSTSKTATTAGAQFCGASAKRVRLEIRTSGGAVVTLFDPATGPQDQLFKIATSLPLLVLDKRTHGTLVQIALSAQVAAGTELCTVTETVED
jgi:hypothetical protein